MTESDRIHELRQALEPFAAFARRVCSPQFGSDAEIIAVADDIALTQGVFRRAQEAMVKRLPCEIARSQ